MEEVWKPLKNYEEQYQISSFGNIKSLKNGKLRKQHKNNRGYLKVVLSKNNINKNHLVHRLVAETFIPNPNCYSEINHKDWNKENNKIDNLEWCDRKYNANYGTKPIEKWKKDLMILNELRNNVVKNGNVLQNVVNNACE